MEGKPQTDSCPRRQQADKTDDQCALTFQIKPGKKAGLQTVTLSTEIAGVEFASADGVWVPAAK